MLQVFNYSHDHTLETASDDSPPPLPPLDILEIEYGIGQGGEYLVQAERLPPIFKIEAQSQFQDGNVVPACGVYVRGILVITFIKGMIMSFNSPRLEVNGRDRNDVYRSEVREKEKAVYVSK